MGLLNGLILQYSHRETRFLIGSASVVFDVSVESRTVLRQFDPPFQRKIAGLLRTGQKAESQSTRRKMRGCRVTPSVEAELFFASILHGCKVAHARELRFALL